jgi:hypothetical protein
LEFGVDVHGVDVILAAAALGCDVAVAKDAKWIVSAIHDV